MLSCMVLVVTGDYPRPWIFQVVPMEQYWFFDEVDDDDLARLSCNPHQALAT